VYPTSDGNLSLDICPFLLSKDLHGFSARALVGSGCDVRWGMDPTSETFGSCMGFGAGACTFANGWNFAPSDNPP